MKIQQLLLLALLVAPYTMALDFGANIRGGLAENMKSVNSESIGVDVQQRALGSYSSGKGKGKGKGKSKMSKGKGKGKGKSKMSKGKGKSKSKGKGSSSSKKYSSKGYSSEKSYSSGKGKGKGEKMYEEKDYKKEPVCDTPAETFYVYAEDSPIFNLDYHCKEDKCIGAVIPFKNDLYLDHYYHDKAGYSIGHCILVAKHPDPYDPHKFIPQYYCLFSIVIDYEEHKYDYCKYEGEIAFAGYGTPEGTFLITAASGAYEGEEGSLTTNDKGDNKFEYKLEFV